jgi:hypothetical protein
MVEPAQRFVPRKRRYPLLINRRRELGTPRRCQPAARSRLIEHDHVVAQPTRQHTFHSILLPCFDQLVDQVRGPTASPMPRRLAQSRPAAFRIREPIETGTKDRISAPSGSSSGFFVPARNFFLGNSFLADPLTDPIVSSSRLAHLNPKQGGRTTHIPESWGTPTRGPRRGDLSGQDPLNQAFSGSCWTVRLPTKHTIARRKSWAR